MFGKNIDDIYKHDSGCKECCLFCSFNFACNNCARVHCSHKNNKKDKNITLEFRSKSSKKVCDEESYQSRLMQFLKNILCKSTMYRLIIFCFNQINTKLRRMLYWSIVSKYDELYIKGLFSKQ